MTKRIDLYRQLLLQAGFEEAAQNPYHFWKRLTEKTAFIVNLKDLPAGVGVVYGCRSTATLMSEEGWAFFRERGTDDDDCNLRFYLEIPSEDDEQPTGDVIRALYDEYRLIDKDTLLKTVKELRKQFIARITGVLKPLGFRKKGNQWRKHLSDDIVLQFWADKSPYADLYYFEVNIYSLKSSRGLWCYMKRLEAKGTDVFDWKKASEANCRFDWQLQSVADLQEIMNRAWEEDLRPFMDNDLLELGGQPFVWKRCICPRDCCEICWIQKNLWEAKETGGH